MAANLNAPAGTGTANFKIPRSWDTSVPKFTTDNKDDLRDFIDQCEDIYVLSGINDAQERKILLTSYLGRRRREEWRAMPEFTTGTWDEFKAAI
jgi:hypothetical protein